jgi:hypothetical protein
MFDENIMNSAQTVEVIQQQQGAFLPQNSAAPGSAVMTMDGIERASIDIQVSTAKQYPRSISTFLNNCIGAATIDRETAESLFYSVPVGKDGNGQKFVKGPSIRLAELVAAFYKNLRYQTDIIGQDGKGVTARAIVFDLENNTARSITHTESIIDKYGKPYSDRQQERIKDVAQSKALRKALFTVVPMALVKPIILAAERVIAGDAKGIEERRKALVAWLDSLKIDKKRVWNAMGVAGIADLTPEHIIELGGIYNAIKNGDTTVDDAFPPIPKYRKDAEEKGGDIFAMDDAAKAQEGDSK